MFGGGCFWCIEVVFEVMDGVLVVVLGYVGGSIDDLIYEQVCIGCFGYVEVVQIVYDFEKVFYVQLLEVFFCIYDLIMLNW